MIDYYLKLRIFIMECTLFTFFVNLKALSASGISEKFSFSGVHSFILI